MQSKLRRESLDSAASHYAQYIGMAEEYLQRRGLSLEDGQKAQLGLVVEPLPGHDAYVGRLAIPYVTPAGVKDIRFRAVGPQEPKYMGLPGNETRMYNVKAILEADSYIAVCEGEIDTITLHHKVGIPAVGIPGVNNWKPHYRKLLQDFETILIFADGDQPGQDFARKVSREISGVVIVNMPEGEDVNSMYMLNGEQWLKEKAGIK